MHQTRFRRTLRWALMFQSPYGGIGASDEDNGIVVGRTFVEFQSPYGGIGASDRCS